eukprot:1172355-Rhodomonas_salina.1
MDRERAHHERHAGKDMVRKVALPTVTTRKDTARERRGRYHNVGPGEFRTNGFDMPVNARGFQIVFDLELRVRKRRVPNRRKNRAVRRPPVLDCTASRGQYRRWRRGIGPW